MKANTHHHLKTKRLQKALNRPLFQVVGILETLWLVTGECAWSGGIGRFSDIEIEEAIEWDGPPGELVAALVACRWLDRDASDALGDMCRLVVHDWEDHVPDYLHKRIARERLRRTQDKDLRQQSSDNGRPRPGLSDDSGHSPPLSDNGALGRAEQADSETDSGDEHYSLNRPERSHGKGVEGVRFTRSKAVQLRDVSIPAPLNTPEARAAIADWLEHQRSLGKPYTRAAAVALLLEEFVRDGPEAFISAVKFSIARNYQGLVRSTPNGRQFDNTVGSGQKYDPHAKEKDSQYGKW